jgi:outer membrane scaffolding protein for murein synthesis (MipA/OmpV family)
MMRHFSWMAAAGALITALILSVTPAKADDSARIFGEQDGLFAISEKRDRSFADLGVAYVNRATYVGSENSDNLVLPFIRTDYKGRLFINPALGAGVYWRNTDNLRVSTSVNFALGRDGEDTPLIGDGGEVDSSFAVTNALRYYLPFAAFDAIATTPFTGGFGGSRLDTLLTTEVKPIKGLRITPGVRATFGTAGWTGTLYNIDAEDLPALGITELDAFQASGGLLALGAHTAAYYELPNNFQLIGVVNYSALQGDAKDSPLSVENSGLTLALGLAKHF